MAALADDFSGTLRARAASAAQSRLLPHLLPHSPLLFAAAAGSSSGDGSDESGNFGLSTGFSNAVSTTMGIGKKAA